MHEIRAQRHRVHDARTFSYVQSTTKPHACIMHTLRMRAICTYATRMHDARDVHDACILHGRATRMHDARSCACMHFTRCSHACMMHARSGAAIRRARVPQFKGGPACLHAAIVLLFRVQLHASCTWSVLRMLGRHRPHRQPCSPTLRVAVCLEAFSHVRAMSRNACCSRRHRCGLFVSACLAKPGRTSAERHLVRRCLRVSRHTAVRNRQPCLRTRQFQRSSAVRSRSRPCRARCRMQGQQRARQGLPRHRARDDASLGLARGCVALGCGAALRWPAPCVIGGQSCGRWSLQGR